MRLIGISVGFGLALAAIVQAALLYRVSSRVDELGAQVKALGEARDQPPRGAPTTVDPGLPRSAGEPPRAAVPVFTVGGTAAAEGGPPSRPAGLPAMLGEALATPEGREQLRGAMALIKEEERRQRLSKRAVQEVAADERDRDRLIRLGGLAPQEQQRVRDLYQQLSETRQRSIAEMHAGQKDAEQADDVIDNAEEETERQVRALLGEPRWKAFQEAEKKEREARRRERAVQQAQTNVNLPQP